LALSMNRSVIAPRLGALPELQAHVGRKWLHLYEGQLTPDIPFAAMRDPLQPTEDEHPDLSYFDWDAIARTTLHFYCYSEAPETLHAERSAAVPDSSTRCGVSTQLTNRIGSTASEAAHQDLASDRLGRTAVRSVGWVVVDRWGTRIASLLTIVVLGRLLAPHDFGLVALAAMFMSFATIFVEQGFGKALIQKRVLREEHTQSAFWASFATAIVLTLSVILVAPLVASATGTPELAAVLRWMSIGLIVNALT